MIVYMHNNEEMLYNLFMFVLLDFFHFWLQSIYKAPFFLAFSL